MGTILTRLDQPRVAVPLLLTLAVLLRLPNLGESLWLDEVLYSTHFRNTDAAHLWRFLLENPAAPLYPVLTYGWVTLAGDAEWLVRTPSMLFALGSIVLTFFIAKRFGDRGMPFLAGLFLVFSPVHVWYSQEATPYAMTMFFLLAAVAIQPRASLAPARWTWLAAYLVAVLAAVLSHYYAAIFLLPFTVLAARSAAPMRYRLLLATGLLVLVLTVVIGAQYAHGTLVSGGDFLRPFTGFAWWMLFFNWFAHGNTLRAISPYRDSLTRLLGQPWMIAIQVACAVVFLCGLLPRRTRPVALTAAGPSAGQPWWELALYVGCLPAVLFVLTLAGWDHLYIERYLMAALPFFAMALARGATRFKSASVRCALAALMITIGVTSYGRLLAQSTSWTVYKQNPDWRSAAEHVRSQSGAATRVLVLAAIPIDDFAFYLDKQLPPQKVIAQRADRSTPDRLRAADPGTRSFMIENTFWRQDSESLLARFVEDPRQQFTGAACFKGVEIYGFVSRDPGAEAVR
jgi:4-amino-4-deoxy-L-arabinose transferase-like glycosyltransferase